MRKNAACRAPTAVTMHSSVLQHTSRANLSKPLLKMDKCERNSTATVFGGGANVASNFDTIVVQAIAHQVFICECKLARHVGAGASKFDAGDQFNLVQKAHPLDV